MEIVDELDFIFVSCQKVSHGLSFWFREWTCTSVGLWARIIMVISIPEVVAIVSIKINSRLNHSTSLSEMRKVHIFPLLVKMTRFLIVLLDSCESIDINSGQENVLILLKKLHLLLVTMNNSTVNEIQHRIKDHGIRDHLSSMVLASDHHCWGLMEMFFKLFLNWGLQKVLWFNHILNLWVLKDREAGNLFRA
jgi:hypothetical protein